MHIGHFGQAARIALKASLLPFCQGCGLGGLTKVVQDVQKLGQLRTAVCWKHQQPGANQFLL